MKILPGQTLGILGGGQLGLMTAMAARRLGYKIAIFEPELQPPASAVADHTFTAAYTDDDVLAQFAEVSDVITLEFENIPAETLQILQALKPVRPQSSILSICQHREREKTFLRDNGVPCAKFAMATSEEELAAATETLGFPCVAKTVAWGYDGKGQRKINTPADIGEAWHSLGADRVIVEEWIPYQRELSVVCARNPDGEIAVFPPSENIHTHHILDVSIVPGRFPEETAAQAIQIGRALAEKLQLEGLLAVELFLTPDNRLLVNEMAPRPHNSGHYTMNGCGISQFEQHVRAVCNLPLGNAELQHPTVMLNLLGDIWQKGDPDWPALFATPQTHLHLYGKKQARIGRKMGHCNICAPTRDEVVHTANKLREKFGLPQILQ